MHILKMLLRAGAAFFAVQSLGQACSCVPTGRACEYLISETVFVGRVVRLAEVRHAAGEDSWTPGYSMVFEVEESLRGDNSKKISVETGFGGGDCGTPLPVGERFLNFANHKDGRLWTGLCSGNRHLASADEDKASIEEYRSLIKSGVGSIFGRVVRARTAWDDDDVVDVGVRPFGNVVLRARTGREGATARTSSDGSYEFAGLAVGAYKVTPEVPNGLDYDHEYDDRYTAKLSSGQCVNVGFELQPRTRIRGHVTRPVGAGKSSIEVVAIPVHLKKLNQFSGKWDFTDEKGRFDLWPLPPGDYYVGVNINSSPKADAPFAPTFYPGVIEEKVAKVIHLAEGEVRDLELPLTQVAKARVVRFTAIGLDGKPMRKIYVQLEDLRHPGDAFSYVNVDLDEAGTGTLNVFAGYSYHLHGSHWMKSGVYWCGKPVAVTAGSEPVSVKFEMDKQSPRCNLAEIDGLR